MMHAGLQTSDGDCSGSSSSSSSYPRLQQYGDIGYRDIVLSTLKVILCIVSQSTSKVWRCLQQQCSSFLHKVVVSYSLCGQLDLQVRMV